MGGGHLMRCLTLADDLLKQGVNISFITMDSPGNLSDLIKNSGYELHMLTYKTSFDWFLDASEVKKILCQEDKPDWLIVDHYGLDERWECLVRQYVSRIMVIDDLANRSHDCDLLLDQNYYLGYQNRYDGLLPNHCVSLLGPKHVVLRQEFKKAMINRHARRAKIQRILIFFGATDPTNQTAVVLEAIKELTYEKITYDVVVGATNPNKDTIKSLCANIPNVIYNCQITNMAELILMADIAIGAGGAAMWERCCLGLPTITVVFADNQEQTTKDVANLGAIIYLGRVQYIGVQEYIGAIKKMISNPQLIKKISNRALELVDPNDDSDSLIMDHLMNKVSYSKKALH